MSDSETKRPVHSSKRCYRIAGENTTPLRAWMNRHLWLLSLYGTALGALRAYPSVSIRWYPHRVLTVRNLAVDSVFATAKAEIKQVSPRTADRHKTTT
jgi:hypothetical protein